MTTVTISVPLPLSAGIDAKTARELFVLSLVDGGRLSQSEGAEILGISRYDLIELMGKHGIPIVRYGPGDLERETKHLEELDRIRALKGVAQSGTSKSKRSRLQRAPAR